MTNTPTFKYYLEAWLYIRQNKLKGVRVVQLRQWEWQIEQDAVVALREPLKEVRS